MLLPGRMAINKKATMLEGSILLRALLLVAAIAVTYAGSLEGPFVFDDRGTIIDNHTIEDLSSAQVLRAPHETPAAGRPLVNVSFAINYAFDGRDPESYHAVNIALHTLCALALLVIVARVQPSANAAFAVALIWAIHPLNTEAVNYVTQRTELLMGLCYLATLLCAIRAAARPRRRGIWEVAAIAACALGMASKESMVTAPIAVILFDRAFLFASFREAFGARRRLYAGLAATWALLAVLIWTSPRDLSAGFTAHDADAWTYLLNQTVMISRYLQLAVWPRDLVLFYGWPLPLTLGDVWMYALLVLTLLGLTAVAMWRRPRAGFLALWFFLTLAPTSSVLPIMTEAGAERRMYLPLIALIALAVFGWQSLAAQIAPARRRGTIHAIALLAVAAALVVGTIARTREYRSSLRLAETSFERWPVPGTHSMYGTELAAAGRFAEAETHLRAASSLHPPARYYLATVLAALGRHDEAISSFEQYLAESPAELEMVRHARGLLAESLIAGGRVSDAASVYRRMIATNPHDREARRLLAQTLIRLEAFEEAVPLYRHLVAETPDDPRVLGGLGIALASIGRVEEAVPYFERAVALDPGNARARQNLARARALLRN